MKEEFYEEGTKGIVMRQNKTDVEVTSDQGSKEPIDGVKWVCHSQSHGDPKQDLTKGTRL